MFGPCGGGSRSGVLSTGWLTQSPPNHPPRQEPPTLFAGEGIDGKHKAGVKVAVHPIQRTDATVRKLLCREVGEVALWTGGGRLVAILRCVTLDLENFGLAPTACPQFRPAGGPAFVRP